MIGKARADVAAWLNFEEMGLVKL